jgi:hypothetical protein
LSLQDLWAAHRRGATIAELRPLARGGQESFYLAVLAHGHGDQPAAATLAGQAAREDADRVVYAETARYLDANGGAEVDVYASPEPFSAFATGGGNVGLYQAAHQALRSVYAGHAGLRLLDVGCGEGHALLPALAELSGEIAEVDAVEPAQQRLAVVAAELGRRGIRHRAHACTVQEFVARAGPQRWDLVQETFALLALTRDERVDLFRWLRPRTSRLALVEFDVPQLGSGLEPGRFRYLVDAYERGLREYDRERELVAQGFLVPVLLGTLADTGSAHAEQPIRWWVDDLVAAGFEPAPPVHIHDYWWAPAYLIVAASTARSRTA